MPTYRDKGIVLRRRPLRDADRHYNVFTEAHGKIIVLAKGSRKGKSKLSPHLGGFGVVDIMVAKGKRIDRLAGAALTRPFRTVAASLEKSALVQGVLAVVDALTRRELPEERVFRLLEDLLAVVDARPAPPSGTRDLVFDAAVFRLLDALGFALELHACVGCRSALVPDGNALNIIHGGVECASCRLPTSLAVTADAIKALRFLREGALIDAAALALGPRHRREVGFVCDLLLSSHLEERSEALRYLKAVA